MRRAAFAATLLTLLAAAPAGAAVAARPAKFSVGVAQASIAPPAGIGIYSGGFGIGAPITADKVRAQSPIEVRAMVIGNGKRAVGFVVADVQAFFPGYQEGPQYGTAVIRSEAARRIAAASGVEMTADDIIVQGSYTHSGATLEGLWGPVPEVYLQLVHQRAIDVLAEAARNAQPAHLQSAQLAVPELLDTALNQGGEYQGWAVDDQLSVLRAVEARTGATIGTFFNVPVHPDLFGGATTHILSDDYLGAARARLDDVLGGVSIGSPATVGRQEAPVQTTTPQEADWYGQTVANRVAEALSGNARWVTSKRLSSADSIVEVPGTNPALLALNEAWHGTPEQRQQVADATGIYPVDRSDQPPYLTGNVIGTPQTTIRIGNLLYLSMPGEPFPEIRKTIAADTKGADAVIALSKAQDDLAYFYPAPLYPVTIAWGSDHYEYNVAPQAGDQIIAGAEANIAEVGFASGPGIAFPLDNDYQQMLQPGLQLLANPLSGDAGPDGLMTTSVQAIFSPAHTGGSPISGLVHWDFGDGTTADTHALKDGSNTLPAWFDHAFSVGSHTVTATATDSGGKVATATMRIVVHPPLEPAISVAGDTWRASVSGGDGHVLAYRWKFADGSTADGEVAHHAAGDGAVLTVTDGTGATATARRS